MNDTLAEINSKLKYIFWLKAYNAKDAKEKAKYYKIWSDRVDLGLYYSIELYNDAINSKSFP